MRSLALAQAWNDAGGECLFLSARAAESVLQKLRQESVANRQLDVDPGGSQDMEWTIGEATTFGAEWIVLDGYRFEEKFSTAVVNAGFRLLTIDDLANLSQYSAECVLNQNPLAHEALYARRDAETVLLLGPRFALLRREFRRPRRPRVHRALAKRVLITLGQSARANNVAQILEGLNQIGDLAVWVAGVEAAAIPPTSHLRVRAMQAVPDMSEPIEWADLALTAASSTCWELAALECPMLITVSAENQRRSAGGLKRAGAAVVLSDLTMLTAAEVAQAVATVANDLTLREELARSGSALVDGGGVHRVLERLRRPRLHLRPATTADCKTVYDWSNDADVRAASFSSEPIGWGDHRRWFDQRLSDSNCILLIGEGKDGRAIGQVRFQIEGRHATISVSLAPAARGLGYGSALIEKSTSVLMSRRSDVTEVHAFIKPQNQTSVNAFERTDFIRSEPAPSRPDALLLIRGR